MVGTPYFMAPEIYELHGKAEAYNTPVDIYALGVSMHRILTGDWPFESENLADLEHEKLEGKIKLWHPAW